MRIIEITEDKVSSLSEHIEKGLRYLGKAMQIVDEMENKGEMGERWDDDEFRRPRMMGEDYGSRYGDSGRYGGRRGGMSGMRNRY